MKVKDIRIVVYFPKAQRTLHFSHPEIDDEYDRLAFVLEEQDATVTYQHLAGESYIPNEETFELVDSKTIKV